MYPPMYPRLGRVGAERSKGGCFLRTFKPGEGLFFAGLGPAMHEKPLMDPRAEPGEND